MASGKATVSMRQRDRPVCRGRFCSGLFHRSDANFMAYRCVKTDSTADRETTAAGTTGNMRNVHQMWTFIGKNQFKCLHRILWKFHTAAEIVSGSGRNVAENDTGNIFYSAQDFLYRTITANGNQLDLTIFRNRGSNGSRKFNSMSFIFCKKVWYLIFRSRRMFSRSLQIRAPCRNGSWDL